MVPNPLGRGVEESYDFDVTKSDKLFDFLLEKGQIKLPDNHVMLPPDQLKNKKFCKFHNATSHSTNECRVDPEMQISADEYREIRRHRGQQKSRYE